MQKEMCNRSTLCFIQRKNMGFDLKKKKKQGMCVGWILPVIRFYHFFQNRFLIWILDWTKAETSRNHHDMMDFPLTQDQPVDSDLWMSHCVNVIHHQWHQWPHMCLDGTLIVFSPLFVCLSFSFFLWWWTGRINIRVRRLTLFRPCQRSPSVSEMCTENGGKPLVPSSVMADIC